jgi:hypothetical protein
MTGALRFNSWQQQRFNLSAVFGLILRRTYSPAHCSSPKDKAPEPWVMKVIPAPLTRLALHYDMVLNQSWGQLHISVSP